MITPEDIEVGAIAIDRGILPQDIAISFAQIIAEDIYCQWVAGHYGACVLGREHRQTTYDPEY